MMPFVKQYVGIGRERLPRREFTWVCTQTRCLNIIVGITAGFAGTGLTIFKE